MKNNRTEIEKTIKEAQAWLEKAQTMLADIDKEAAAAHLGYPENIRPVLEALELLNDACFEDSEYGQKAQKALQTLRAMSEAQTIMSMLEAVDKNDTAMLEEIDARFWCLGRGNQFDTRANGVIFYFETGCGRCNIPKSSIPQYTRSRDALKAVRPEGWSFTIKKKLNMSGWIATLRENKSLYLVNNLWLPTEELAEMHAIVQAIDWERNNEK